MTTTSSCSPPSSPSEPGAPLPTTALLLSLSLAGCDFFPETPGAADDTAVGATGDCVAAVTVPIGTTGDDDDTVPADPHALVFGSETPDPYAVRLGWPSRDPSTSVSMLWRTDVDTLASVVEIGPADTFPEGATAVEGYTFLFGGGEVGEGAYRVHEVRLCGAVQPGTTYSYRVGGEGHWSPTYTFSTPGAPGSFDTFRVAIAGDSRGDYATWAAAIAAMESHAPDLYLFSGDMVELGANQSEWEDWFAATGDLLARKPFLAAHGNHEFLAQHYFAQFGFPGNEEWYAVEWGDLLVLSLNDTVRSDDDIDSVQKAFIEQELAATSRPWRVAMHHQPAYSACTAHDSNLEVREAWSGAFEEGGVQVVTAGHNHIYERSVPIRAGEQVAEGDGTVYLVSGGAGADLYENTDDAWWNAVANPVEHYVIADFGPSQADFVVRDLDGNVIDQFSVPR